MELQDAFYKRISVRKFTDQPVTRETLAQVLTLAGRSPSGMNTQPWEYFVIAGEPMVALKTDMIEHLRAGTPPAPEVIIPGWPKDSLYRERQVAIAKQLFELMDIARNDSAQRLAWMERGFRFFDAPAAIFLTYDKSLYEPGPLLDMGAIMQSICLAAVEYGLGSCIEGQGVQYPQVLRKHVQIPESKKIVIAIAIGYPDPDFPANKVKSEREKVDDITTWVGF